MHASSLENMQKCYERYVGRSALIRNDLIRVLDIGGANVNGTYADIFSDGKFEYIATDIAPGEGVDCVLDDPYLLPFEDHSVDIVISGQAFEHVEFFWKLFEEAARIVSRDGFIFIIVPSSGPVHRYPVDCYRFYPDSMKALSRYASIALLECWNDERGPWKDLIGIFAHRFEPAEDVAELLPVNRYMAESRAAPLISVDQGVDVERTSGQEPYDQFLGRIHRVLQPRGYLEIGVRKGRSLDLAHCPSIAVDPASDLDRPLREDSRLYDLTSDAFFEQYSKLVNESFDLDLAFIDGMHLFEFALRDFMNVERRAARTTVVVIDDIYPNHVTQAARQRQSRVWAGDVLKLHHCLEQYRPDLILIPVDTHPTGILIVAGLDPGNTVLWDRYNPLVRQYRAMSLVGQERSVLTRQNSRSPHDQEIAGLLTRLRAERDRDSCGNADPRLSPSRSFEP